DVGGFAAPEVANPPTSPPRFRGDGGGRQVVSRGGAGQSAERTSRSAGGARREVGGCDESGELLARGVRAEGGLARLEAHTLGERADRQGVEAERVDERSDRRDVVGVIPRERDRLATRCARRAGLVLEVVITHVVEGLDEPRP